MVCVHRSRRRRGGTGHRGGWALPAALAASALVFAAGATSPALAVSWPFVRYTEAEGAPTSTVMGVAQDGRGRMWFATRVGMVCYDGSSWEVQDVTSGLPVNWQSDVVVDHEGTLWAVAQTTPVRVSRRTEAGWEQLPAWPEVGADSEANELVAGRDGDGGVALAVLTQPGRVAVWSRGRWGELRLPSHAGAVHSLAWRGSELYAACAGGLFQADDPGRDGAEGASQVAGLPPGPAYAAVIHPVTGVLHVAGRGWYAALTNTGVQLQAGADSLRVVEPGFGVDAAIDAIGGLYVGSARSLQYLHPLVGLERLDRASGLVSSGLSDILVDREGSTWIANLRGMDKLANRRLRSLAAVDGLLADEVSAVLQRRDGTVVLGHAGGLTFLDHGGHAEPRLRRLVAPGQDWSRAMDLHEDEAGALWVALDRSGLARLDGETAHWYGPDDGLSGPVYSVTQDTSGALWVAGGRGLHRREGSRFVPVPIPEGPPRLSIRRLHAAADGAILGATGIAGAFRLRDGRAEFWPGDEAAGHSSCYALHEPAGGGVWVGTAGGLCRVEGGRLVATTAPDPVISEPVYAITADDSGRVWFGTGAGILAWDGSTLHRYGVADGLCGAETNRDALTFDAEGRLWIGTDRGVSILDERLAHPGRVQVPLWISSCELDGRRHEPDAELRVPSEAHELVVRFAAPAFTDEARLRFATLLDGADSDWSEPAPNPTRSLHYRHLRPGRYRVHVRAIDAAGSRSEVASTGVIVVAAPLTARPWFAALAVGAVAGVVWLFGSLVQGRRYATRLAGEVAQRTADLALSEVAVRAESQRLGAVLASISDGVMALDGDDRITLANPAAVSLVAPDDGLPVGTMVAERLPGLAGAARAALAAAGVAAGGPASGRAVFEYRRAAGTVAATLECAAAPLAAAGGRGGLVLAFRDNTERRRAEQAAIRTQKLESLGVLAGGIAHDFNNLLTVIMGNASLLELECQPGQRRPLEQIGNAAARAQRLTAQLLTFARGGSPQKRLVDLRRLLEEASTLALAGTNASLDLDLPEDLWDAEVDPGQVEQVISNLLINARQAMPGGGRVRVSARNTARTGADGESGRQVEVRVSDEGCGIDPADLERIFEPYFTTKVTGTGLGLAISHSVVARHGGSLRVSSEPGRGAEFTLLLPASRERARDATTPAPAAPRGGRRLLVMDDEPPVRELLARLIQRLGHEVQAVPDGDSALAAWSEAKAAGRPFDAAIMDLTIPGGMGGREAMARLQGIDPGARAIVTSGYSQDPVMADHLRHGFVAKLPKPFNGDDVARVLRMTFGTS